MHTRGRVDLDALVNTEFEAMGVRDAMTTLGVLVDAGSDAGSATALTRAIEIASVLRGRTENPREPVPRPRQPRFLHALSADGEPRQEVCYDGESLAEVFTDLTMAPPGDVIVVAHEVVAIPDPFMSDPQAIAVVIAYAPSGEVAWRTEITDVGGLLLVGAGLWAIGMGAQESVFKAAIAALVPRDQRGRAYGRFFAAFGLAWWIGSTAMGWLYERSIPALVGFSIATQLAAVPILLVLARKLSSAQRSV